MQDDFANAGTEPSEFLGGRMLISMPGIDDERFARTVLLVCSHTEEQAMAIAVNRPLEGVGLGGLLGRLGVKSEIALPEDPVLLGGPVDRERGHVLHTADYTSPGSTVLIADNLALTSTREVLDAMAQPAQRPRRSLLALGYAGWDAGQLEHEIQESVWLICDADESLIFDTDHDTKWSRALAKIGVTPDRLSTQTGRA